MSTSAIRVRQLNHWFGTGEARKQAIFNINLAIERGSLTVMMGPSGSGKTTLLTLMACLRDVQDGSVELLGQELARASGAMRVQIRRRLGFIFQAHNLHESLNATENVEMGLQVGSIGNPREQTAAARHILTSLGLKDRLNYLPQNLSGGQKQRVAIARALVGNPQVIFADEPTAALDRETGFSTVQLLKRLAEARGTTTIMVTHDHRILDLADRVIELEDGQIVGDTQSR